MKSNLFVPKNVPGWDRWYGVWWVMKSTGWGEGFRGHSGVGWAIGSGGGVMKSTGWGGA